MCFSAAIDGASDYELWGIRFAPFRITAIERLGDDIQLAWTTVGGITNIVQALDDGISGTFTNFSDPIILPGLDAATATFTDFGAAANASPRVYRITRP